MKKHLLLPLLIFIYSLGFSQPPGSGNTGCAPWLLIELNSQAEVDSFPINFADSSYIGCLKIYGQDINNLDSLISIESIGNNLIIGSGSPMGDLTGPFSGNPLLMNLDGLNNLSVVGNLVLIYDNDLLSDLSGLSNLTSCEFLWINGNDGLSDLSGLDNLVTINGWLGIGDNNGLTTLNGIEGVTSVGHNLTISNNQSLVNLDGLQGISSIGMHLAITDNPILEDITALENIDPVSITSLSIFDNPLLSVCDIETVCNYIILDNAVVSIENNASGCNTQQEVEDACTIINTLSEIDASSFSIFPNPASDLLFISNKDGLFINEINIYNQVGQKVFHLNNPTNRIDVSSLKRGIYIVELIAGKDVIIEKILVE